MARRHIKTIEYVIRDMHDQGKTEDEIVEYIVEDEGCPSEKLASTLVNAALDEEDSDG